jgi:hypothetical protein
VLASTHLPVATNSSSELHYVYHLSISNGILPGRFPDGSSVLSSTSIDNSLISHLQMISVCSVVILEMK